LITYSINAAKCIGCTVCAAVCPVDAIEGEIKAVHKIDAEACIRCGMCQSVCRYDAVEIT
jgi:NADH-quinone oxidoreductase subunit F